MLLLLPPLLLFAMLLLPPGMFTGGMPGLGKSTLALAKELEETSKGPIHAGVCLHKQYRASTKQCMHASRTGILQIVTIRTYKNDGFLGGQRGLSV
jgi:hypothetical protein